MTQSPDAGFFAARGEFVGALPIRAAFSVKPAGGNQACLRTTKLIIETPEQTALEFRLAGVGSRALALAIDTLMQAAVGVALAIVAGIISAAGFLPHAGKQWG